MKYHWSLLLLLSVFFGMTNFSCNAQGVYAVPLKAPPGKAIAAFAEGCFWHAEIVFEAIVGVDSAISGYAGGHKKNPTYGQVTSETTGHAETVLVYYDPKIVSYNELLRAFFDSVDPTQKDRQGNDIGTSYRSVIFYSNEAEAAAARAAIKQEQSRYKAPIVTEVTPLKVFYRAENYHQDYIAHNPNTPYVRAVSIPEYREFRKHYKGNLKPKDPF